MTKAKNAIIARFEDQPALMDEGRLSWFETCAQAASDFLTSEKPAQFAAETFWYPPDDWRSQYRPYTVMNGVLQIPVKGLLLNNFPWQDSDWATGYEYIQAAFDRGMDDPEVKGIAFIVDSGGGMVSGNLDLVDRIYARRGEKPIASFASDFAYSAAYAIASVADTLNVSRTGGVGSIGVVVIHVEVSKALEENGYTVTIIRSKPGKMEGNGYEPLSAAAKARIQERVDAFHKDFVALVARNRGLTEEAVDATNALTFMPKQAVEIGLADAIGNFDDAFTAFVASINSEGVSPMAGIEQAVHEQALADASTIAKAEGVKEGAAAAQVRIAAILDSAEAKDRPVAARFMAFETEKTSADAIVALGKFPVEKAEVKEPAKVIVAGAGVPKKIFDAAMGNTTNPDLGAGDEADDATKPKDKAKEVTDLVQSLGLAGYKPKEK